MHVVRVRVWLDDRPGALGAVASRIGSVRGDVIGIDILERGGGRAVDDLVVSLPDDSVVDLLVSEIGQVDGVDVEYVVALGGESYDPDLDALDAAATLVAAESPSAMVTRLCDLVADGTGADWVAVLDLTTNAPLATAGSMPAVDWVVAFVRGSQSSELVMTGQAGPDDVAWAALGGPDRAIAMGRDGHPFRTRELRRFRALARVVDARLGQFDA
jgi:hypothetical protein